jgi:serine/threonine protein kinase
MLHWGLAARHGEAPAAPALPGEREPPEGSAQPSPRPGLWRRLRRALGFTGAGKTEREGGESLLSGGWEKVRRLGFGSFAEVWLVREAGKENLAVAKIPHNKKLNVKFLREAAILKRLGGHPNTARLLGIAKEEGKAIIIQEYAEGETLQEMMDRGMDAGLKENAFLELLDVVACAHRHRIMHRDIKPENIIIGPSGHLKLLDFGTGKDLTRRSISSTIIGSRPFMAPEQIMGESRLSSDVWALGVILYALSTEYLPFYDENEKHLMDLILEVEPDRPRNLEPGLPVELETIILKCLEKDWNRRYRDATEFRKDLLTVFPEFGKGNSLVPR